MHSNLSFQVNGIQCGYEPAAPRKLEGESKTFVLLPIVSWETAYYPVNIDCQLNKTGEPSSKNSNDYFKGTLEEQRNSREQCNRIGAHVC